MPGTARVVCGLGLGWIPPQLQHDWLVVGARQVSHIPHLPADGEEASDPYIVESARILAGIRMGSAVLGWQSDAVSLQPC